VLFARLRPYLNKAWRAERDGACSAEFRVIRIKEDVPALLLNYLAAVLRSSVVVAQTKHMMTGNTHPRLANEDVVNLFNKEVKDTYGDKGNCLNLYQYPPLNPLKKIIFTISLYILTKIRIYDEFIPTSLFLKPFQKSRWRRIS
jgi:hypothetical protein